MIFSLVLCAGEYIRAIEISLVLCLAIQCVSRTSEYELSKVKKT